MSLVRSLLLGLLVFICLLPRSLWAGDSFYESLYIQVGKGGFLDSEAFTGFLFSKFPVDARALKCWGRRPARLYQERLWILNYTSVYGLSEEMVADARNSNIQAIERLQGLLLAGNRRFVEDLLRNRANYPNYSDDVVSEFDGAFIFWEDGQTIGLMALASRVKYGGAAMPPVRKFVLDEREPSAMFRKIDLALCEMSAGFDYGKKLR